MPGITASSSTMSGSDLGDALQGSLAGGGDQTVKPASSSASFSTDRFRARRRRPAHVAVRPFVIIAFQGIASSCIARRYVEGSNWSDQARAFAKRRRQIVSASIVELGLDAAEVAELTSRLSASSHRRPRSGPARVSGGGHRLCRLAPAQRQRALGASPAARRRSTGFIMKSSVHRQRRRRVPRARWPDHHDRRRWAPCALRAHRLRPQPSMPGMRGRSGSHRGAAPASARRAARRGA